MSGKKEATFCLINGGLDIPLDISSGAEPPAAPQAKKVDKKKAKKGETGPVLQVLEGTEVDSTLTTDEKYELCMSLAEECIQPEELRTLLDKKKFPICYDGFEPSGRMHIAQGLMKSLNVNKLTKSGCVFVFWVADWFAMLNNKYGGDLDKIKKVGEYFVEVWKACGMDMRNVKILHASTEIGKHPESYWTRVMNIAQKSSISRIKRCCTIMGKSEGDEQPAAQILYPCMQCADIFYIKADICQLGMDQRKVNTLARDYCENFKGMRKPVILSHPMLPGLKAGQEKMSKSDPSSAIFMEDTVQEVNKKIKGAFCPPVVWEGNPCVSYIQYIVFPALGRFHVERKEDFGGNRTYNKLDDIRKDYESEDLHPGDLKAALASHLNELLEPVREHFRSNPHARALVETIKKF